MNNCSFRTSMKIHKPQAGALYRDDMDASALLVNHSVIKNK
jgi:hypothetical protein